MEKEEKELETVPEPDLNSEEQNASEVAELQPSPNTTPTKPPRNYAQLKADLKKGKGVVLSVEENKIFWRGRIDDDAAVKAREAAATQRFWAATDQLTGNILCKILFYSVYGVWSITPIVGIVIGIIYSKATHCPGKPSIAPLMIVLGLMSVLVGFSVVSQKSRKRSGESNKATPVQHAEDEDVERGPCLQQDPVPSEEERNLPSTLAQTAGVCAGGFMVCFIVIFKFVHLILFIATSVIVYRFYPLVKYTKIGLTESEIDSFYCNEVLYLFAFWSLTLSLMILGFLVFSCCFGCCSFIAWTSYASREQNTTPNHNQSSN